TFDQPDELGRALRLIVFVIADRAGSNPVMLQQPPRGARVLARDPVGFFQQTNSTICDVFQIANGSRNHIKQSGHNPSIGPPPAASAAVQTSCVSGSSNELRQRQFKRAASAAVQTSCVSGSSNEPRQQQLKRPASVPDPPAAFAPQQQRVAERVRHSRAPSEALASLRPRHTGQVRTGCGHPVYERDGTNK